MTTLIKLANRERRSPEKVAVNYKITLSSLRRCSKCANRFRPANNYVCVELAGQSVAYNGVCDEFNETDILDVVAIDLKAKIKSCDIEVQAYIKSLERGLKTYQKMISDKLTEYKNKA